jgi:hypothetical protein
MSQNSTPLLSLTIVAAAAITTRRCVGFDNNQASTQGQKVKAIANMPALAAGDLITGIAVGTAVAEAGGAFNAGDTLICDNVGRVIVTTSALKIATGAVAVTSVAANGVTDLVGSDTPEFVVGRALEASAGAGSFVEILVGR